MRLGYLLAGLLAVGCAATPAPSPASSDLPSAVIDELIISRLVAMDVDGPAVTLELVQWFSGPDAANEAARADGVIGPNDDLPEPFYVRDLGQRRVIRVAEDATVIVLGYDAEGNIEPDQVPLAEFAAHWQRGPASGAWTAAAYDWCSIGNGRIVRIEAQYVP